MTLTRLWLSDFRCFSEAVVAPDTGGLTVFHGPNGSGKTSLLEAVGWVATLRSIRGGSRENVVRRGAQRAILRAQTSSGGHEDLIEVEIPLDRQGRTLLNRQVVRRRSDLARALRVSVFSPSDRRLVEGGPAERRGYLDEVLATQHARLESMVDEVELVLRQRSALLRQAGGRLVPAVSDSLVVWDSRLAETGTTLACERERLVCELEPLVSDAYKRLAESDDRVTLCYRRSWEGDLFAALEAARNEDLRRQLTTVGPHRDELEVCLDPSPARTHASQGEQRCIALALRLATHELRSRDALEQPLLLLDDVFSELDARRSEALIDLLPRGQVLLTTAVGPPGAVAAHRVVEVSPAGLLVSGASR